MDEQIAREKEAAKYLRAKLKKVTIFVVSATAVVFVVANEYLIIALWKDVNGPG